MPLRLGMSGCAMGRMQSAMLNGERKGCRELATAGRLWAFHDLAEMTDKPMAALGLGEPVRLEIVDDTVLVAAIVTREIAVTVDNPGDWLFHCHMLGHAASGMTTWARVT